MTKSPDLEVIFQGIQVNIIHVTPSQAALWLKKGNKDNRNIRPTIIEKYTRLMLSGEWWLSDSAIIFDDIGILLNGHHRLKSCVESGTPIHAIVVFGCPRQFVHGFDRGATRTISECFKMAGDENLSDKKIVSLARAFIDPAMRTASKLLTDQQIREIYYEHKVAIDFAHSAIKGAHGIYRVSVAAALARACYYEPRSGLEQFAREFTAQASVQSRPVVLLTRFINNVKGQVSPGVRTDLYRKAERAIFACCRGEDLKVLKAADEDIYSLERTGLQLEEVASVD